MMCFWGVLGTEEGVSSLWFASVGFLGGHDMKILEEREKKEIL